MTFSERVKAVRNQLEITQEELAHKLGVSFATVNRWESGSYKPSKMGQRVFEEFVEKNNIDLGENV